MKVIDLKEYLEKIISEGKGEYVIESIDVDFNTANGGYYNIENNYLIDKDEIEVDDDKKTVSLSKYFEYYAY